MQETVVGKQTTQCPQAGFAGALHLRNVRHLRDFSLAFSNSSSSCRGISSKRWIRLERPRHQRIKLLTDSGHIVLPSLAPIVLCLCRHFNVRHSQTSIITLAALTALQRPLVWHTIFISPYLNKKLLAQISLTVHDLEPRKRIHLVIFQMSNKKKNEVKRAFFPSI